MTMPYVPESWHDMIESEIVRALGLDDLDTLCWDDEFCELCQDSTPQPSVELDVNMRQVFACRTCITELLTFIEGES